MNNTLAQLSRCSPPASQQQLGLHFTTPAPRDFTESESEYASSTLDDRHILVQKIDSLKLQLAESQKREEYLRSINENLQGVIAKMENSIREQDQLQHYEGTFLRSATFQDSLASVHQLPLQRSGQQEQLKDYYERRMKELAEAHETEKEALEQRYATQMQQTRQQLETESKNHLARQLELMQSEIRVHFEKERAKAEAYIRTLLPDKARMNSPSSYFVPSPLHNSGTRQSQSQLVPELHTSCIETVQADLNSHRSEVQRQRESLPSKKVDISVSTRNVATDLFCENCRTTFTPTEFFPHARNCQRKHESEAESSIQESRWQLPVQMRPQSSFSDMPRPVVDSSEPGSSERKSQPMDLDFDLLQALLRKKEEIQFRIEGLKYSKNSENRREREMLQTDLDQLVLVIQKRRRYQNPSSNSKRLHRRSGKSFCSSIFKDSKNISRIYLEDRPLLKKNPSCRKENSSRCQNMLQPAISLTTSVKYSAPATPTTAKRLLKRF